MKNVITKQTSRGRLKHLKVLSFQHSGKAERRAVCHKILREEEEGEREAKIRDGLSTERRPIRV